MSTRRSFLSQAGVLAAGLTLAKPNSLFAAPPSNLKVGIQLYSMREYLPKDPKGTIARIAKAGYTEVETFGFDTTKKTFWGLTPKEFKAVLTENGLTSPSGHYGMDQFLGEGKEDELNASIEAAKALGQTMLVIPYLNEKFRKTAADLKPLAHKVNGIGEICKKAGLKTGYHNHDFEFKPVEGISIYETLLKETDPKTIQFEMDIYWVVRAGQDPIKLIKDHPGRFAAWHIKDMDKAKPELNTEIGSGSIDFKEIFKYQKLSGVKHIYMEQENFGMDAYQSIAQSAAYIKNSLLK